MELLETRTLLSGWSTVDTLPPASSGDAVVSMAADGAGNIYAAGSYGGQPLLRVKAAGNSSFVTVPTPVPSGYSVGAVFADPQNDLFITAGSVSIFEQKAGGQTFAPVPVNIPGGATWVLFGPPAFAADAAGDVFAVGMVTVPTGTTTSHGKTTTTYSRYGTVFEMKAGQSGFSPAYQESTSTFAPYAVSLIPTGPSAGIYVVDAAGSTVAVRKSADGGATWSKLPALTAPLNYTADVSVASDPAANGNLYVSGEGTQTESVITGYTYTTVKGKIVQSPIYSTTSHWLTEQSADGGATWTVVDNVASTDWPNVTAVADFNGTVYVAGETGQTTGHGIVRSNAGGTWQTVDDTGATVYDALAVDPVTGTPYAGGILSLNGPGPGIGWSVRSGPPTVSAAATTAMATFSTTTITHTTISDTDASPPDSHRKHSLFGNPRDRLHLPQPAALPAATSSDPTD